MHSNSISYIIFPQGWSSCIQYLWKMRFFIRWRTTPNGWGKSKLLVSRQNYAIWRMTERLKQKAWKKQKTRITLNCNDNIPKANQQLEDKYKLQWLHAKLYQMMNKFKHLRHGKNVWEQWPKTKQKAIYGSKTCDGKHHNKSQIQIMDNKICS